MTVIAAISLAIWIYLLAAHGRFWQSGPTLAVSRPTITPAVAAIVPARDEAPLIARTLGSLLAQDYPGRFRVILVDDNSTDDSAEIARALNSPRLIVFSGAPRPPNWAGKLWAVAQGIAEAEEADFLLFTDADIEHDPAHVANLIAHAERHELDLVSEMVALSCATWAEHALIPAFVFFFQLLYPFAHVNDPLRATAAAAGGTVLIRRRALTRIGGIESIRSALIDDVALAAKIKIGGPIWLGHATLARSIRPYPRLTDIWRMITRSAYVQLRYSPVLLVVCTIAMALVWIVPPLAVILGTATARILGALTWAAMAWSYLPTLRRFGLSLFWAPCLPVIALFYLAATVGSAVNHYFGRGVAWKGRAYDFSRRGRGHALGRRSEG
jgi:hopene-associated glycosyltransferase HpnB